MSSLKGVTRVSTEVKKYKYHIAIGIHKLFTILYMLFAALCVLSVLISYFTDLGEFNINVLYGIPFIAIISYIHFKLFKGLEHEATWAGVLSLIIGVLLLAAFPIGTLLGLILIISIVKQWYFPSV